MAKKKSTVPVDHVTGMEHDWQASSDCDTLCRAHEIRSDAGRHKRAVHHAKKQMKSLATATATKI